MGKYIAEKRKALGLTQKQLAEQLGMSDKSVSKWERGICLPDVSVYMELCGILGISMNEFLAGEDISEENIVKIAEDNLIQVAKDSKAEAEKSEGDYCCDASDHSPYGVCSWKHDIPALKSAAKLYDAS